MIFNTDFYERCIATISKAIEELKKSERNSIEYELYRSATIKEFEIILEQSGKLLKKCLLPYFPTKKAVDRLSFKDIFRHAAKHGLISVNESERWSQYRDNRNELSHDYGKELAEKTLPLIPRFIKDAQSIVQVVNTHNGTQEKT